MERDQIMRALLTKAATYANTDEWVHGYFGGSAIFRVPGGEIQRWILAFPDPTMVPDAVQAKGEKMEDVMPKLREVARKSIKRAITENPQAFGALIVGGMHEDVNPFYGYSEE